jgi:hypothetical protein
MDLLPSDDDLTVSGLPAAGGGRVLLLACGALAREVLAVVQANGWTIWTCTACPRTCTCGPTGSPSAVERRR